MNETLFTAAIVGFWLLFFVTVFLLTSLFFLRRERREDVNYYLETIENITREKNGAVEGLLDQVEKYYKVVVSQYLNASTARKQLEEFLQQHGRMPEMEVGKVTFRNCTLRPGSFVASDGRLKEVEDV